MWVDFNDYAENLILGADADPWKTPAEYISFYQQAHSLVGAEVVAINVWGLYESWMSTDKDAIPSMSGKRRVTVALKKMLEAASPREFLAELLIALNDNYGANTPIVLVLPSPRSLLVKANKAANGVDVIPDETGIDTAAMYMADYLRYFSELEISGILLVEDSNLLPMSTEEVSWYQPVFNIAKHYRWSLGVKLAFDQDGFELPDDIEFCISTTNGHDRGITFGLDVTDALWKEGVDYEDIPRTDDFFYLTIPVEVKPETVLDRLFELGKEH